MANIITCYRYEDSNGYGPFYNERKHIYNWEDDSWRHGCTTIEKLKEWWSNKTELLSDKYKIVKYTLDLNKKNVLKAKETFMVDFKLDEVLNKEDGLQCEYYY